MNERKSLGFIDYPKTKDQNASQYLTTKYILNFVIEFEFSDIGLYLHLTPDTQSNLC